MHIAHCWISHAKAQLSVADKTAKELCDRIIDHNGMTDILLKVKLKPQTQWTSPV